MNINQCKTILLVLSKCVLATQALIVVHSIFFTATSAGLRGNPSLCTCISMEAWKGSGLCTQSPYHALAALAALARGYQMCHLYPLKIFINTGTGYIL